ncbi:VOC family protein [Streptomyces catenulae]|uniref:VOC family protein n=1 Tax=Streptomyces catenulae TaxID=66875 RepID=A0ABV2Z3Q5_9ACTN|nr:VOC family protein [Streptomyces catenulae]
MAIQRMDNVGLVVDDMEAAKAFFTELGLELEGTAPIEGPWVDRIFGLPGVRSDIAMMRTPDGHSRLELTTFHSPPPFTPTPPNLPPSTLGTCRLMFAVDDIHDTVARLHPHGGELLGEISQFENAYLLCYLRGPGGVLIALAEALGQEAAEG